MYITRGRGAYVNSLLTWLDPDFRLLPGLSGGLPAGRVDC